jgi:hypothetical protein
MSSSVPCAPRLPRARQIQRHVGDPRLHPLPRPAQIVDHLTPVHGRFGNQAVARGDVVLHRLGERLGVRQIADADAAASHLVLVGRTDPARRRADAPLAAPRFAEEIEVAVIRQDEVRLVADDEAIADADAGLRDLVDLGEQRLRIDDDAVADDAGDAVMQDAGRQQPQNELPAVGVDRVSGVVAALIARDDREVRRQQVDDLALALVSPLRAEHGDVHT